MTTLNIQLCERHRKIQRSYELFKTRFRETEGYNDYFHNRKCPYEPDNNRGYWVWADGNNYYTEYMTWWKGYNLAKDGIDSLFLKEKGKNYTDSIPRFTSLQQALSSIDEELFRINFIKRKES